MRSTLAWAQNALSRPGFGEVRPALLKAARRRGKEAAARLVAKGAGSEEARAMQASLRYVFAREELGGTSARGICDGDRSIRGIS